MKWRSDWRWGWKRGLGPYFWRTSNATPRNRKAVDVYNQILDREQRSWVLCLLVLSEEEMNNFFKVAGEPCSYRSYDTWSLIRKISYSHWKKISLLSVACVSGCKSLLSLSQCFSNLSVHQNQLEGGLVKTQTAALTPRISGTAKNLLLMLLVRGPHWDPPD